MNRTRAFRRSRAALIKKAIRRDLNTLFYRWDSDPYIRSWDDDVYRARVLRRNMRNEGKGRTYKCRCEWCLAGKQARDKRQILKLNDEHAAFIQHGIFCDEDLLDDFITELAITPLTQRTR